MTRLRVTSPGGSWLPNATCAPSVSTAGSPCAWSGSSARIVKPCPWKTVNSTRPVFCATVSVGEIDVMPLMPVDAFVTRRTSFVVRLIR